MGITGDGERIRFPAEELARFMQMTAYRFEIKYKIEALRPDERNAGVYSDQQVARIADSIAAFGFNVPVLVDENGGGATGGRSRPNHVHLILTPDDPAGLALALARGRRLTAGFVNARARQTGPSVSGAVRFGRMWRRTI